MDTNNIYKEACQHFAIASGIRASLVKVSGEIEYQFAKVCASNCNVCDNCEALGQSIPVIGRFIYFCHKGLAHIASPIFKDGKLIYGLFVGPLPTTLSPEATHSFSELLHYTTSHLSYRLGHPSFEIPDVIARYIEQLSERDGVHNNEGFYPLEKEEELLAAMANGDALIARSILNELLGYIFFYSGLRFDVVRSRVLELVVLLSRAAMKGGANPELIFGLNFDYLKEISRFNTIEELAQWLSEIMNRFTDHVFRTKTKHSDIILKATGYIKSNYMRKLSLDDVAGAVFLSPTYFSRIFKKETGISFSTYLNKVRTDEGKRLLKNAEINISDIAGMIGYEDQSYFSKVFKKVTGMSPLKYRQTR